MAHVDHGLWKRYTPPKPRDDAPMGAMFAQRESDGQDWYEYVHPDPNPNFKAENIVIAAYWRDDFNGYLVGPAVYHPDMIFPAGQGIWEIDDYSGSDPQADLGGKLYDPATGSFSDPPPVEGPLQRMIREEVQKALKGAK